MTVLPQGNDTVPSDLSVIQGEYLTDILCQPRALEDTLQSLTPDSSLLELAVQLNRGKFHRVVLTGMGSSFHALHPLNLELISCGFTSVMVETSELLHYAKRFFDPKTLLVAVSQSGQSIEMLRLVEANDRHSALIAVTNTPDSPLANGADATVLTEAGKEFSVSCKTYVTALMALGWLGRALCQRDLRRTRLQLAHAAPAVATYLKHWRENVESLVTKLRDMRHLFFVGRGASLAAVGTGALIVKESARFHAEGMSSAAFRHGPFEMLGEGTMVLVFSGDEKTKGLNHRLFEDVRRQGGCAELLGEDSSYAPFRIAEDLGNIRPILEILPVQMITLAIAAQQGRQPGRFELASKVTITE
jgi:glucosamine--fructose-6-phosphate aminotransferase (isomerizing)